MFAPLIIRDMPSLIVHDAPPSIIHNLHRRPRPATVDCPKCSTPLLICQVCSTLDCPKSSTFTRLFFFFSRCEASVATVSCLSECLLMRLACVHRLLFRFADSRNPGVCRRGRLGRAALHPALRHQARGDHARGGEWFYYSLVAAAAAAAVLAMPLFVQTAVRVDPMAYKVTTVTTLFW